MGRADGGEEALTLVLRERPDIVIADLLMPRLNGIELTRRIKQELPDTKIILMTGYTGEANRRLAFLGGAERRRFEATGDSSNPSSRAA